MKKAGFLMTRLICIILVILLLTPKLHPESEILDGVILSFKPVMRTICLALEDCYRLRFSGLQTEVLIRLSGHVG